MERGSRAWVADVKDEQQKQCGAIDTAEADARRKTRAKSRVVVREGQEHV